MKNIAIQMFGHLRSYKKVYKSLIENLEIANKKIGYNVDIFIHTWTETDHSSITWHNWEGEKRGIRINKEIENNIMKFYKPKSILITDQLDVEDFIITEKIGGVPRSFKGVVNVAYTKYMSTQLRIEYAKKNNIKYDYVIVTRPDIIFHSPFIIDDFLYIYKEYKWDIPENGIFFGHNHFARGLLEDKHMIGGSDIIFFGNEDSINKATSLYKKIKDNKLDIENLKNNFYCFEYFWYEYWISQGLEPIKLKYFQFSDYNIIRNEEEYAKFMDSYKEKQKEIHDIKVSSLDSIDNNYIYTKISNVNDSEKKETFFQKLFYINKTSDYVIINLLFIKLTIKRKTK